MDQRTLEWMAARCGHVTASRVASLMVKKADSKSREALLSQIICERLTGEIQQGYTSAPMERGTELEPVARAMYEVEHGVMVDECGFIKHPSIAWFGASPDGLVGSSGLVELKCPNTTTHVATLIRGSYDTAYKWQIQAQLSCTGREWCDFGTFDDRLPEGLQFASFRVYRDDAAIAELEAAVVAFNECVTQAIESLFEKYGRIES